MYLVYLVYLVHIMPGVGGLRRRVGGANSEGTMITTSCSSLPVLYFVGVCTIVVIVGVFVTF